MSSEEGKKKIKLLMMLEIIGKPPEHLVETLESLIKQMSEEKGVEIKSKDIKEPTQMKEQVGVMDKGGKEEAKQHNDFYTTFAEVEVDTETGSVKVTRVVAVQDAGKIINPLLARSQHI